MGDIAVGKPLNFDVSYNDVGKQPAFAVRPTYTIKAIDKEVFEASQSNAMIEADNVCKGKKIADGADVIYPGQPNGYTLRFTLRPGWIDQSIVDGDRALVLEMCFTYKTIHEVHHTSFCYFYRKGITRDARLNTCTAGNHAD